MSNEVDEKHPVFPITSAQAKALPRASFLSYYNKGGNYLGVLREGIKCRATFHSGNVPVVSGEQCKWGSSERVAIAVCDLEQMADGIAASAVNEFIDDMINKAHACEGMETWPGWHGDIGEMNLPRGYELIARPNTDFDGVAGYSVHRRNAEEGVFQGEIKNTREEATIEAWRVAHLNQD